MKRARAAPYLAGTHITIPRKRNLPVTAEQARKVRKGGPSVKAMLNAIREGGGEGVKDGY